ncbi:hypothetical protein [Wolbachia endosymbiont of Liriomyza huidobrensis]
MSLQQMVSSQCLGTGMTKESSVSYLHNTIYCATYFSMKLLA